jgi:hypothetical protein
MDDRRLDEAIDGAAREMMRVDGPQDLRRRVMARLQQPASPRAWWPRIALASAAVVLVVGVLVTRTPQPAIEAPAMPSLASGAPSPEPRAPGPEPRATNPESRASSPESRAPDPPVAIAPLPPIEPITIPPAGPPGIEPPPLAVAPLEGMPDITFDPLSVDDPF